MNKKTVAVSDSIEELERIAVASDTPADKWTIEDFETGRTIDHL